MKFEEYLMEKHDQQHVGTDETLVDDFNDWLVALDPQEIIDYAEKWLEVVTKETKKQVLSNVNEQLRDATVKNIGLPNGDTVLIEVSKTMLQELYEGRLKC